MGPLMTFWLMGKKREKSKKRREQKRKNRMRLMERPSEILDNNNKSHCEPAQTRADNRECMCAVCKCMWHIRNWHANECVDSRGQSTQCRIIRCGIHKYAFNEWSVRCHGRRGYEDTASTRAKWKKQTKRIQWDMERQPMMNRCWRCVFNFE